MRTVVLGSISIACLAAMAVYGFGRPTKKVFRWPMFSHSSRVVLILHDQDGHWVNPYQDLMPGDHGLNLQKLTLLLSLYQQQGRKVSGLALLRDREGEEVFRIVDNVIATL